MNYQVQAYVTCVSHHFAENFKINRIAEYRQGSVKGRFVVIMPVKLPFTSGEGRHLSIALLPGVVNHTQVSVSVWNNCFVIEII